jgi:hypothetical protein
MMMDYTNQFYLAVAVGLAVGLAGLMNVFTLRLRWPGRLGLTVVVAALPIAGLALLLPDPRLIVSAVGVVVSLLLIVGVAGSKPVVAVAARPAVRWTGLAALGSGVWYERALDADAEEKVRELELAESQPLLDVVATAAVTDRGHPVETKRPTAARPAGETATLDEARLRTHHLLLSVIRLAPADDVSNCHGWVFTGGKYWVGGKQVDPILTENGYSHVLAPAAGDLIVYRDSDGNVTHSAVVRATPAGLAPLVESKWGCLGVFLHPVDKSPYGTDFTCYRSPRVGHLLAGLTTPAGPAKVLLP